MSLSATGGIYNVVEKSAPILSMETPPRNRHPERSAAQSKDPGDPNRATAVESFPTTNPSNLYLRRQPDRITALTALSAQQTTPRQCPPPRNRHPERSAAQSKDPGDPNRATAVESFPTKNPSSLYLRGHPDRITALTALTAQQTTPRQCPPPRNRHPERSAAQSKDPGDPNRATAVESFPTKNPSSLYLRGHPDRITALTALTAQQTTPRQCPPPRNRHPERSAAQSKDPGDPNRATAVESFPTTNPSNLYLRRHPTELPRLPRSKPPRAFLSGTTCR